MNLNELRDRAYNTACNHGFHDKELPDEHLLMLVITEISEAVQADRKDRHADVETFNRLNNTTLDCFEPIFASYIKDTVEDELADVCIRLLDLCGLRNIDLAHVAEMRVYVREPFTALCYTCCRCLTYDDTPLTDKILYVLNLLVDYCEEHNIDLLWHIEQKQKYNETRPYKHDRKY